MAVEALKRLKKKALVRVWLVRLGFVFFDHSALLVFFLQSV